MSWEGWGMFFFLFQSLVKYIYVNVKNIYLKTLI